LLFVQIKQLETYINFISICYVRKYIVRKNFDKRNLDPLNVPERSVFFEKEKIGFETNTKVDSDNDDKQKKSNTSQLTEQQEIKLEKNIKTHNTVTKKLFHETFSAIEEFNSKKMRNMYAQLQEEKKLSKELNEKLYQNLSKIANSEAELVKKKDQLEVELDQKTKKLIHSERLTAIGEMAARLAHDLRNPLSVISNELELIKLREPNPNEKMQTSQDRINRSIQRMSHQLEDVMDFVRMKPLDLKNQSIRDLLTSTVNSIAIPSEIKINLPENDCRISVDSTQMGIIFVNLIFNSIQAMNNYGKINITIFDNLENTVIEFQDSGPGISEENLETIFEPLFTTKQTGTGLGLVSCMTIVKQHGGTLSVKNNPTTFTVTIPKIIKKLEKECLV